MGPLPIEHDDAPAKGTGAHLVEGIIHLVEVDVPGRHLVEEEAPLEVVLDE